MYFVSFRILNIAKYNLFHLLCKQKTKNSNNMKRKDNTLTRIEFQVMSILWDINSPACGHDILERYDEPKPSYTTIATTRKNPTPTPTHIIRVVLFIILET